MRQGVGRTCYKLRMRLRREVPIRERWPWQAHATILGVALLFGTIISVAVVGIFDHRSHHEHAQRLDDITKTPDCARGWTVFWTGSKWRCRPAGSAEIAVCGRGFDCSVYVRR